MWHDYLRRTRRRVNQIIKLTWRWIRSFSLGAKIIGLTLGVVILLGLVMINYVSITVAQVFTETLQERGIAIANELAQSSAQPILQNDIETLSNLVRSAVNRDQDITYILVMGGEGSILTNAYKGEAPPEALSVDLEDAPDTPQVSVIETDEGKVHNVLVRVFPDQDYAIQVGLSSALMSRAVDTIVRRLSMITILVLGAGLGAALLLTEVLTRPLNRLMEATRTLGQGDLYHRVYVETGDEIGQLTTSFNSMMDDLARSREESEAYNKRLLRNNRELAALNGVIQVVSDSSDLDQTMERALEQVLAVIDSEVGWICLLDEDGACWTFVGSNQEMCASHDDENDHVCLKNCVCHKAQVTRELVWVNALNPGCPLKTTHKDDKRPIIGHVSMPLVAKGRVVGQLNIACHFDRGFDQSDLDLLAAMGPQLGVAIENARLWEEVRRKEVLREELLKKVVSAQEDERRRLSRELHDEMGQLLTSILINLKVLEGVKNSAQRNDLTGEIKNIVSQTLDTVHHLALELRPSVLDDLGLVPALERYVKTCPKRCGFAVEFATIGLDGIRLSREIETTLYRIAQESLTNAARHSGADRVSLLLERRGNSVVVIVEDNGVGFNVKEVMSPTSESNKLGLYGIEERAILVGGKLTIESNPGMGATVFVEVPMVEASL
jgi:signal transduction histidine kinase